MMYVASWTEKELFVTSFILYLQQGHVKIEDNEALKKSSSCFLESNVNVIVVHIYIKLGMMIKRSKRRL